MWVYWKACLRNKPVKSDVEKTTKPKGNIYLNKNVHNMAFH